MHTYEMATLTIPALEAAIAFILGGPLGAGVKFWISTSGQAEDPQGPGLDQELRL